MEFLLLMLVPTLADLAFDPTLDAWQTQRQMRSMECVRMTQAAAHERFPGRVPEPSPRANVPDADAMACTRRIMVEGERPARDEAILSSLSRTVGDIAEVAEATVPGDRMWHVESFYPDARVASKIAVAARTHFAERGRSVSDRVPLLAAGDIVVLGSMEPKDAYRAACARYFAEHSLGSADAFLGIMLVDPRETNLHAGVCVDGEWKWLR